MLGVQPCLCHEISPLRVLSFSKVWRACSNFEAQPTPQRSCPL
ncbi:hypothetical protein KPSA3_07649 [Pseudomonas syringae pv. actinidiae]|uniref:Uncharacterized protein n=1 Tax=Pseudomonas syringae pv. actinidiae TaxID=103796 RepID=A0AAN4TQN3_PSESF|nr:hypothetical protein KPSA3_07649 [Pseudomonas syringae pv. actinidiae]